ncbi:MAG: PmoA family protein [Phycisphaeraceae bacterium]
MNLLKKQLYTLTAAATLALLPTSAFAGKIESIDNADKTIRTVTINGEVFTNIITGEIEGYPAYTKPFLFPIIGPTGANMTRSYPMVKDVQNESDDHPHHQSLWFAHGKVSGTDFWHSRKNTGKIPSSVASSAKEKPAQTLLNTNWLTGKDEVLADAPVRYSFAVLPDGSRTIDYHTMISPAKDIEQLVFGDTKEGMMAFRLHPALRLKGEVATGKAINSNGQKDNAIWGKRAKWVAYWGVIDGKTCGVAIFDHPTNLRHPTWWHARDYGLVAANPFGISDFEKGKHKRGAGEYTLKQGETLKLQYRFVFFAGTAEEADIAGKYDQWLTDTMPVPDQEPIAD